LLIITAPFPLQKYENFVIVLKSTHMKVHWASTSWVSITWASFPVKHSSLVYHSLPHTKVLGKKINGISVIGTIHVSYAILIGGGGSTAI
jgi:hypothetical protein